ncbi:MAG: response regulator [Candidatus Binatia bacterium]
MARVLVIEDDGPMRQMIRKMLERDGHDVTEARDGVEALQLFRTQPAEVAVVDIYLPEVDGWETIRELHRLTPDLPFVLVSGGAPLEIVRKGATGTLDAARQVAAFRVLRKPFTWDALTGAVDDLLSASSQTGGRHSAAAEARS